MRVETKIEKRAVKKAEALGWISLKVQWTHYPDRLFIGSKGAMVFIEFKDPDGDLRPGQAAQIRILEKREIPVHVCDSVQGTLEALNLYE